MGVAEMMVYLEVLLLLLLDLLGDLLASWNAFFLLVDLYCLRWVVLLVDSFID